LPSSGDEAFNFKRIGRVTLGGLLGGASLAVIWMEGYAGGLFLPFRDATSGSETYGGGRYLLDTVKGADLGGDSGARRARARLQHGLSPVVRLRPALELPVGATREPPASCRARRTLVRSPAGRALPHTSESVPDTFP
jgi:hypothetical protein